MSDGKFIFVEEISKSYSTSGIVEYTEVYTHKDKGGRSEFVVKVDIENYLVSITGPSGKVWSQDVRENTDRAKKAKNGMIGQKCLMIGTKIHTLHQHIRSNLLC